MMLAFDIALWIHIAAGCVALAVFWIPLVTKKGGTIHRRVGWIYVGAAATIAATGFITCARMFKDPRPGPHRSAVFFLYIGIMAAASAQLGVRALRTKSRTAASRNAIDLAPPALLVIGGLALAAFGAYVHMLLYVAFAALGMSLGVGQLRFWLVAPRTSREWFYAHMTGMGVSCITTLTAFSVLNAHRLGLATFNIALWTAPAGLGALGLALWQRSYKLARSTR